MIEYYKLKPNFPSSYSGECVYYLSHSLSWVKGVKLWRLQTCRHPKRNPKKTKNKKKTIKQRARLIRKLNGLGPVDNRPSTE